MLDTLLLILLVSYVVSAVTVSVTRNATVVGIAHKHMVLVAPAGVAAIVLATVILAVLP